MKLGLDVLTMAWYFRKPAQRTRRVQEHTKSWYRRIKTLATQKLITDSGTWCRELRSGTAYVFSHADDVLLSSHSKEFSWLCWKTGEENKLWVQTNRVIEVIKIKQLKIKHKVESGIKGDQLTSSCLLLSNSTSYPLSNNSENAMETDHLAQDGPGRSVLSTGKKHWSVGFAYTRYPFQILDMSKKYIPLHKL